MSSSLPTSLSLSDREPMTDDRKNQMVDLMELKCYPRDERDDDRRRDEGRPTTRRRARVLVEEKAGLGRWGCGGKKKGGIASKLVVHCPLRNRIYGGRGERIEKWRLDK